MQAASSTENSEVLQVLLERGAEVNARAENGQTALMYAALWNENPEVVLALLDAGADATAKNGEGTTAWDLIQDNEALKGSKAY